MHPPSPMLLLAETMADISDAIPLIAIAFLVLLGGLLVVLIMGYCLMRLFRLP